MRLTDEQISENEERVSKASRGPWRAEYEGRETYYWTFFSVGPALVRGVPRDPNHPVYREVVDSLKPRQRAQAVATIEQQWADIDFVRAARTDVPALVSDLKEAREALKAAQSELDLCRKATPNLTGIPNG